MLIILKGKHKLHLHLKVEKAVSDAQQESQFMDFLDQHLFQLSDITWNSTAVKFINLYSISFFE